MVEAPKGWGLGRVSSSLMGEGSGERAVSPLQEFFFIFELEMMRLGAYCVLFLTVRLSVLHAK